MPSSKVTPKTDSCKDVRKVAWGEKGALNNAAFDVANCYNWEIRARQ